MNRIRIAADVETRKENGWGKTKREKTPYFHCGPLINNWRLYRVSMYVLVISPAHLRVNPHSIVS